jgi:AbiV family abortive infection protein
MGRTSRRKKNPVNRPAARTERAARARYLDNALASASADAKTLVEPIGYRGSLTIDQANHGMVFAFGNAKRLLADAEMLLKARSASAAALAILAMEEAAKIPILRAIAYCHTDEGIALRWRDYASHRAKIAAVNAPYGDPGGSTGHRMQAITLLKELSDRFEALKEHALYSDAVDENRVAWHTPENFPHDTTSAIVEMAQLVLIAPKYDAKEVKLWDRYVLPAVEKPTDQFCAAIAKGDRQV